MKLSIISKISQREKTYKAIKQAIISYEVKPGEPLAEEQIANKLGVSRTPVREALKELRKEGLVKIIHRKGAFVAEISSKDVEEIFLLREILECAAEKIAIPRLKEEDLIEMESLFNSISKDIEMKNYKNIFDTDIKLHSLIVDTAGNRRLSKFLNILNGQVHRMRVLSATAPGRLNKSLQEHKDILEALKKRDIDLAEQRLKQHIRNIKNNILEML
ncbi:MAG: GntR family transcriptional regulator [Candidatus Neomarinimicrobiota bacterium]|nr:MAG: GntR family transcriptional regulator [Candidatus Neomarinimicrobiota bacterium]